jgi:signal transduction histidine kinase
LRNHLTGARLALQTIPTEDPRAESIGVALQQLELAELQIKRLLAVRSQPSGAASNPMDANAVQRTVIALVKPMALHRNVTLDVFPPEDDSLGKNDTIIPAGQSMVTVLLNLLVNAVEAVGIGGKVWLEHEIRDSPEPLVRWRVGDNGPGPSGAIVESMFEPFATTKPEGVGLGLAMCQQIVHALGGKIRWYREDGKTVFEVTIPLEKQYASA